MFTSKRAVNSGQLPNRFMLSFFFLLHSPTQTPSHTTPPPPPPLPWEPQVLAVMAMKWVLTEWGFQPQREPLSLAADDKAPSVLRVCISLPHLQNLYHHCSHPCSLCHVRPSSSLFCLAQLCCPLQLWAVMSLGHFFFFFCCEYKMWSPSFVFDDLLPHVALRAVLKKHLHIFI